MIYIAIILVVVAAIAALVAFVDKDIRSEALATTICCLVAAGIFAVCGSVVVVDAGSVGVQVTFGTVNPQPVENGLHLVNPFSSVQEMTVRTENYWMSHVAHEGQKAHDDAISVRASNGLQMPVDVSVPYRLIPDTAPWVFSNLGSNYVEKLIRPSLSTATRRAASHYTAEELYSTRRDEFSDKIQTLMEEEIHKLLGDNYKGKNPPENVIVVSQVLVGHVGIPDTVKNAIELKLKADQDQQAMEFVNMKATKEAERKEIEAKGIQKFQEIVSKGIDEHLLKWKAIEATEKLAESSNAKIIIIGAGKDGLPVILGNDSLKDSK